MKWILAMKKKEMRMAEKMVEKRLNEVETIVFLFAGACSIVVSLLLQFIGRKHESLFIGQWAPTLFILGLYKKILEIRH